MKHPIPGSSSRCSTIFSPFTYGTFCKIVTDENDETRKIIALLPSGTHTHHETPDCQVLFPNLPYDSDSLTVSLSHLFSRKTTPLLPPSKGSADISVTMSKPCLWLSHFTVLSRPLCQTTFSKWRSQRDTHTRLSCRQLTPPLFLHYTG